MSNKSFTLTQGRATIIRTNSYLIPSEFKSTAVKGERNNFATNQNNQNITSDF